jgi:P4 family phage/plasmid primase-like protien
MTPLDHALYYASRGWRVVPIPTGEKFPKGIPDWQDKATTDETRIRRYWTLNPTHGVGIATGPETGLFVVDVDPDDGGDDSLLVLEQRHGTLPDTIEAITGGGGRHLVFAWPDYGEIRNSASGVLGAGIDVRGAGGQFVVAPTIHPNGTPYAWEVEHDPFDGLAAAPAPEWLLELLQRPLEATQPRRAPIAREKVGTLPGDEWAASTTWADQLAAAGATLHSAHHDSTGNYYELWTRPGKTARDGASASLYYRGSDVLKVFTSNWAPLVAEQTYTLWGFHVELEHGGDFEAAASRQRYSMMAVNGTVATKTPPAPAEQAEAEDEPGPIDQPYTDLGNARRLVATHGDDLRHAPQWGCWLIWDGHRWTEDHTGEVIRRAKAVVDAMLTEIATIADSDDRKRLAAHWMRSQAAPRIEASARLATTEPTIPVTVDQLDADPWTLNTRSGVLDLRTGALLAAERRQLVTKLAPVTVVAGAACPTWEWFVDWAMCGDAELVAFLQRAVGYSLTGTVGEQCLFFCHGHGDNGKSTFLHVLQRLLGEYAAAAEPDLLLATTHERHPAGMADLLGRRLVVVQEVDEGRRLAEATVKQLTGGDTIKARRMRENFFDFRPTHKLWMAANHRPQVRGTDHAIWRRIRMIPFLAQIAEQDKDTTLPERLERELPGILQWALRGLADWRHGGLRPPCSVVAATAEYRIEQDHIGRFIEECCQLAADVCVTAKDLRATYERWCAENGERPWSAKAMGPQLVERGCERFQDGRGKAWTWVGLTLDADPHALTQGLAFQWAAGASPIPGETKSAAHRGPLPSSPPSACAEATYTEKGPQGLQWAADQRAEEPDW